VLLLDEPLSNLDPALRERTRRELRGLIRRVGITTVIVTHEQEDAFDLGDVVAVLRDGRLEQVGTPETLYREPATAFVGEFVGRSSWLNGMVEVPGEVRVEGAAWRILGPLARTTGARVRLLVRPEALRIAPPGQGGIPVTVTDRRFAGASTFYRVVTAAGTPIEAAGAPDAARIGDPAMLLPVSDPADRDRLICCFPDEGT
jgi:ABC-type Fe3+/spermidine/putrescine transport system ATPase subunit